MPGSCNKRGVAEGNALRPPFLTFVQSPFQCSPAADAAHGRKHLTRAFSADPATLIDLHLHPFFLRLPPIPRTDAALSHRFLGSPGLTLPQSAAFSVAGNAGGCGGQGWGARGARMISTLDDCAIFWTSSLWRADGRMFCEQPVAVTLMTPMTYM